MLARLCLNLTRMMMAEFVDAMTPCDFSGCRSLAPISGRPAFLAGCLIELAHRSMSVSYGTRNSSFMITQSRL